MSVKLNHAGYAHARALASQGKIDHSGDWSAPDNPALNDCLGKHEDGSPGYPIIRDGKVSRRGVIAAKEAAAGARGASKNQEIYSAADHLLRMIDGNREMSFYVSSPKGAAFKASDSIQDLPRSIKINVGNSQKEFPVTYLDKLIAAPGHWLNPDTGEQHIITPERLKTWKDNFDRMNAAGIKVPVSSDHSAKAQNNRGWIVRMAYVDDNSPYGGDGDPGLIGTHQLIGDDAVLEALRNDSSIDYNPNYIGSDGTYYGDCITGNALTPVPISTELSSFQQAASRNAAGGGSYNPAANPNERSADMHNLPCTEEHMAALRKLLPGGEKLAPEDAMARVVQHLHTMAQYDDDDAGGPSATSSMSRDQIAAKAQENRKTWKDQANRLTAELTSANAKISEMSRKIPAELDPDSQSALVEAADTKAQVAVAKCGISPATRDRLMSILVKDKAGKINTFAMSRISNPSGSKALALEVFDILGENVIVKTGADSGAQSMSRIIPGGAEQDKDAAEAKAALDEALGVNSK